MLSMQINERSFRLPSEIKAKVEEASEMFRELNTVERIWAQDASVWTNADEAKWLGWLNIVSEEKVLAPKYAAFRDEVSSAGFSDVLLMGMGGSSLCPEVLAKTFGKEQRFHILDSTVPAQVAAVEERLDLEKTLFIVASKSGSTLEPNCFKQYFFEKLVEKVGREQAGKQFVAITDPGSEMEQIAKDDGFWRIFHGKPEIGGRFSALSAFGLTAAASMGLDVGDMLERADRMVDACKSTDPATNPGAMLGLVLGICHGEGRDKLTIFTAPEVHDLGAWLEQLIAESTGKTGVSIIPVDREPAIKADAYGDDRVFAFLSVAGGEGGLKNQFEAVAAAGHPAVWIELGSKEDLGQEFFCWEFATAVAGSVMKINPFNQPDVEAAKIEARKITDEFEETGSLPDESPFYDENEFALFSKDAYAKLLRTTADGESLKDLIDAHIAQVVAGDYFAILAYIEMNAAHEEILTSIRESILRRTGAATCLGFGPRFLHSTGQAYKGGADNGVFLQITSDDAEDIEVPGQKYTFSIVKQAQARGDFQVLLDRDRRALRVHIIGDPTAGLTALAGLI
jgi:transaldolase/glucose-6-phosphate isomerase